jgi:hypothetical protein
MSQTRRTEWTVSFNLWTAQGTWFWSLVYPDRHGGVIGAAASEAEAVSEAQAVIKQFPQLRDNSGIELAPCGDLMFTRPFQSAKDSQFHIGVEIDRANSNFASSLASQKRSSRMRTIDESYNNFWQLTLQQYAARVAAVRANASN